MSYSPDTTKFTPSATAPMSQGPRKIIIDTDPGIDDAIAMIAAFKHPDVEILGLTSVAGNKGLSFTTRNAAAISTYFGAEVPVYQGAANDLVSIEQGQPERDDEAGFVHGVTGLGTVELSHDPKVIQDQAAVDFILETVAKYPGQVDIIALGPVTNLALAVEQDLAVMQQVRSIHSMGGGVYRGNRSPVAEFNYWFDPVAVDRLFTRLGEAVPIYMIGLDVTHQAIMNMNDLTFIRFIGGELGELIYEMMRGYVASYWEQNGYIGAVIHDLVAVMGYLYPEIYPAVYHRHLRCLSEGELSWGQCVVDMQRQFGGAANAYIPLEIDVKSFKERFVEVLFGPEIRERYQEAMVILH